MPDGRRRYGGEQVDVTFDAARCRHAAECARGLPEVFDVARRPWILPDAGDPQLVAEVVRRCPTGALRYELEDGPPEPPQRPTAIDARPGGPLVLRGDLLLRTPEGEVHERRAALCSCGRTQNAPHCDGSGACASWPG